MSTLLQCDQAIFTSLRGPMAEGYRVVAASRGVRNEEKQAITKFSPSHDALCWAPGASSFAASFYALPTGRLCVALSCHAGAEHTGRGGHRVYTHNVLFEARDFSAVGFNPFHVVRAMIAADLGTPQLTPSGTLHELALQVVPNIPAGVGRAFAAAVTPAQGACVLDGLFGDRTLIVPVNGNWVEAAEALLLGLPGPMRVEISFAAGLRFSLTRSHRLHVLVDEKESAKARIAGQPVDYVPREPERPSALSGLAWMRFVERHWQAMDVPALARRTSLPFTECNPGALERVGVLYNGMDSIPTTTTAELLRNAVQALSRTEHGVVEGIRRESLASLHRELSVRLTRSAWKDSAFLWLDLAAAWRRGSEFRAFVVPLMTLALHAALKEDVLAAAEAALDVAQGGADGADSELRARIDEILRRLAMKASTFAPDRSGRFASVCERWQAARPTCPLARQLAVAAKSNPSPTGSTDRFAPAGLRG